MIWVSGRLGVEKMDSWARKKIHRSRKLLENPYAYLNDEGLYEAIPARPASDVYEARRVLGDPYAYLDENGGYSEYKSRHRDPESHLINPDRLLEGHSPGARFSKRDIERIVRKLQKEMWARRAEIWPNRHDIEPLDILDPSVTLTELGFSVELHESLGQFSGVGELFEVAGTVERSNARVRISRRFSPEIRNFTTAHELGHAILHTATALHRDRALDGAADRQSRDPMEAEADIFAAYFLIPEKQLCKEFENRFLTRCFVLNEETAFAFNAGSVDSLQNRCRSLRDLTRMLADAQFFDGEHFPSLARTFRVSVEAMAIRLEELRLVQY